MDGFDLVEALGPRGAQVPLVVFVTAFPRFAADAFDTGAIDFLTKPIRTERVGRAIERVREALEHRNARRRLNELLLQLDQLAAFDPTSRRSETIFGCSAGVKPSVLTSTSSTGWPRKANMFAYSSKAMNIFIAHRLRRWQRSSIRTAASGSIVRTSSSWTRWRRSNVVPLEAIR